MDSTTPGHHGSSDPSGGYFKYLGIQGEVMTPDEFPCEPVTWQESYEMARALAMMVKEDCFGADIVIAFGREGTRPPVWCAISCSRTCSPVSRWSTGGVRRRRNPRSGSGSRWRWRSGTGKSWWWTMSLTPGGPCSTRSSIRDLFPREVRTAVLQHKSGYDSPGLFFPRREGMAMDHLSLGGPRRRGGVLPESSGTRGPPPPARCRTPCSGITAFSHPWLRRTMRLDDLLGNTPRWKSGNATKKSIDSAWPRIRFQTL